MGGIRFEADGTVTLHHRHARLRPGPRHAVRAGAERASSAFRSTSIRLLQGDSDELIIGGGTGGSNRSMQQRHRDRRSRRQGRREGQADRLPRARSGGRRHRISPTAASPSPAPTARSGSWSSRETLRDGGAKLPEDAPQSLDVQLTSASGPGAATFPNGCHVAEVEIDPETGVVEVVKYTSVNDFGIVVNPMLVAGQVHGGVVQGIGQALMEMTVYDARRPAAHRLVHGLRHAARRRRADLRRSPNIRCRRRPTRSASRAAAKPAAPAR